MRKEKVFTTKINPLLILILKVQAAAVRASRHVTFDTRRPSNP